MDEKKREESFKKIEEYTKKIKEEPNNDIYYYNRGTTYANLSNFDNAIKDFNEAIKLNPNDDESYYNRGVTHMELKDYNSAISDFDKAIKLNPNDASYFFNRGTAYANLSNFDNAIINYNEAIKLNPNDDEFYYNRGNAYANLNNDKKAIIDYNEAIKLNPNNAAYFNNRGNIYFNLEEYENAITDFIEAIKLDPNSILNNVKNNANYEKYTKAIESFNRNIDLNLNDDSYYNNKGFLYYLLGNLKKSIRNYNKAIRLKNNIPLYYFNKGNVYLYLEEYKKACKNYDKAIKLEENNIYYIIYRGISYFLLNKIDKAINDFDTVIVLAPNNNLAIELKKMALKVPVQTQNSRENLEKIGKEDNKEMKESYYSSLFHQIDSLYKNGNYQKIKDELLPKIQDFKKESNKQDKTLEIESLLKKVELIETIFKNKPEKLVGFLLFADILGWKGIWKKKDNLDDIANLLFFIKNILEKEFETSKDKYNINLISDTFIIYSENFATSNNFSKKLIELCLENNLVIRGAISYGECYNKETVYVGPAVDEAASWHDEGEEIGIFCTPSAKQEIINNKKIKKSDLLEDFIKLKSGEIKTFFINWYNKETKKKFYELFSKVDKSSVKVYLKYLNTENKLNEILYSKKERNK